MTRRATGQLGRASNLIFCREFFSSFLLVCRRLPIHVENLVLRSQICPGIPMAIEAPLHVQRGILENERHLVDRSVARRTSDPFVHVNAVIEVHIVGQPMHFYPSDGLVRAVTLTNRLQVPNVIEQDGMAIHAGFRWRDSSEGRRLHAGMTITTIDSVISGVMLVAELHGLHPRHALVGDIRRPCHDQDRSQRHARQDRRSEQTKP